MCSTRSTAAIELTEPAARQPRSATSEQTQRIVVDSPAQALFLGQAKGLGRSIHADHVASVPGQEKGHVPTGRAQVE